MGEESQKHPNEIGPFRILRRLRGSSREVYLAESKEKGRVVLKMYGAPLRNQGLFDPEIADSASFYARLAHPNVVRVLDLFSTDGKFVIALEYVDGSTLNVVGAALERAKLELDHVCCYHIGASIFSALAAAHEATDVDGKPAPFIHRNINPSNVHIAWDGTVKLGNFNVAPIIRILRDSNPGFTWGSYGYFAPEQVRLEPLDERTDVYSAMVIVWELLARKKAISRGELQDFELLKAMASPSFERLEVLRPELDAGIHDIVRRGLALEPRDRPSAAEIAEAFRRAIGSEDARPRLAKALAKPRRTSTPRTPSVHDVPTVAPPPLEESAEEELPAVELQSLPPPPAETKPPPLPPMRSPMASMGTSRAFPPPPPPVEPPPPVVAPFEPPLPIVHPFEPASPTPRALALDLPFPSVEATPPPVVAIPPRRGRSKLAFIVVVIVGVVLLVAVVRLATRKPAAVASTPPSTSTAMTTVDPPRQDPPPSDPPAVSAAPIVTAPVVAKPVSTIPPELGELVLPPSAAGHRIFVDGRVMGDGKTPIRVRCGSHMVKIGSGGKAKSVDVPCGDTLTM